MEASYLMQPEIDANWGREALQCSGGNQKKRAGVKKTSESLDLDKNDFFLLQDSAKTY